MRWVRHLSCVGYMRNSYNILVGKPEGERLLEEPSIDGKIILEQILGK
jgi:hypothetical protein